MRCFVCFANKPSETCLLKLCFRPPRSVLAGCRCKVGPKRRRLRPVSPVFRACVTHLLSSAQNTLAPRKIAHPVLGVRASFACPWPCVCTPTPKHVGTHIRPPGRTCTPPRTLAWARMDTQAHIQAYPRYAPSLSHAELRVRPRRPTQLACTPRYAHGKLRVVPRTALGAQAYGRPARHVRQGHVQFCAGPHAIARKAHDIHTRCPTRSSAHRTTRVTDDARAR